MRIREDEKQEIYGKSRQLRIFDVAEFSVHDGPGVRVVVYFQGCNARCDWCHSPHSQPYCAPLLYNPNFCVGCRRCELVCPNQVHRFNQGKHEVDRSACTQCGICIENCPTSVAGVNGSTLHLPTVRLSVAGLLNQIDPYLRITRIKGGITLSGGEALLQLDAVEELLTECKRNGYHTAVETSGLLPLDTYKKVLPLVDLWLFGMRVVTGQTDGWHYQHINNVLDLLTGEGAEILPRIPMVPGFFDKEDVLNGITELLTRHSLRTVCLNPWNRDYEHYYELGGLPLHMSAPSADEIDYCETKITSLFNQLNFTLYENRTIKASNDPQGEESL